MKFISTLAYYVCLPILYPVLHNSRRVRVVLVCNNQVLLIKPRLNKGLWDVPGGGIKRGERRKATACREVSEELGISIKPGNLELIGEYDSTNKPITIKATYYLCELDPKPAVKLQRLELSDYKWVSVRKKQNMPIQLTTQQVLEIVRSSL